MTHSKTSKSMKLQYINTLEIYMATHHNSLVIEKSIDHNSTEQNSHSATDTMQSLQPNQSVKSSKARIQTTYHPK